MRASAERHELLRLSERVERAASLCRDKLRLLPASSAELAKPGTHPEWETNLPADLQKAIQDYLEGVRTQVTYLDCLWDELYGSINANQWGWEITKEQADYLRAKYLFEQEEEEAEDFRQTES